jgi:UDP-glucose 4-epimerase
MKMSKAIMEKVMIVKSKNRSTEETILFGTRYGNLMASCGSVIPLFTELIKNGLPINITDSCMTKFMMSLPDAVELIFFKFDNSKQVIYLLKKLRLL